MIKYAYIHEQSKEYKLQYNILLVGATGAGKSSTINALYEFYSGKHEAIPTQYAKVGDSVAPETMEITKYPMFPYLNIWDSPGLGDGKANDEMHHQKIAAFLKKTKIDLIMVIVDGSGRDLGTIYNVLNKIILPNYSKWKRENIVILINQADMAMKGRNWNKEYNIPNVELKNFLNNQAISIQQRIIEATQLPVNSIIHYSAEKNFNLNEIASLIYNRILIKIDILQERKAEQERQERLEQERLEIQKAILESKTMELVGTKLVITVHIIILLCFYLGFHGAAYLLTLVWILIIIYEEFILSLPLIFLLIAFYFDFNIIGYCILLCLIAVNFISILSLGNDITNIDNEISNN